MTKDLQKHILDYTLLFIIVMVNLFAIFAFKYDRNSQIILSVLLGIEYAIWGTIHHALERTLTLRTLLEYLTISALVTSILIVFLVRT